ncbi:hypothetical protein EXIGLDRAFT_570549, partial [Exidia glandulosa HHB12029]
LRERISCPVIVGPSLPRGDRPDQYEDYCKAMLMLFKPWRTLGDLKTDNETWSDVFHTTSFDDASQDVMRHFMELYECKDASEAYKDLRR